MALVVDFGVDISGNDNDWAPTNLSTTPGIGYDSMSDTPTNDNTNEDGEIRGNYPTANPLDTGPVSNISWTISNGGLTLTSNASNPNSNSQNASQRIPSTGKFYGEVIITQFSIPSVSVPGYIWIQTRTSTGYIGWSVAYSGANPWGQYGWSNSYNSNNAATGAITAGAVLMWAVDASTRQVWLGMNGVWFNSGNPAAGTGALGTHPGTENIFFNFSARNGSTPQIINLNFGQREFDFDPPSGFTALCTTNFPDPTIANGKTQMDILTYNGSTSQQTVSGLDFRPGFSWFKERTTNGIQHNLFNALRGNYRGVLETNATTQEAASTAVITTASGVTLQGGVSTTNDGSGRRYVSWNWRAGDDAIITQYTTPGNYVFTVPTGVTSIRVLVIGGGGASGGSGAGAGSGGAGGSSSFSNMSITVTANGGGGGSGGPNVSGAGGTAGGAGSGGDGGYTGRAGLAGNGGAVVSRYLGTAIQGYGDSAGTYGWGGGGGTGGTRFATLSVTPGDMFNVTVGAGGIPTTIVSPGGLGGPGFPGAVLIYYNRSAQDRWPINQDGTLTSTLSVNPEAGFSIVAWRGTGGGATTIGHGLGSAPRFIINKSWDNTSGWNCYHAALGNTASINMQTTGAANTSSAWWNNTSPTSAVFTIGSNLNIANWNWLSWCFTEVEGYSRFGSYTGTGVANGPFVYTGFRPQFLLIKNTTDPTTAWIIFDSQRDTNNVVDLRLNPNDTNAEALFANAFDFLSNGIKVRSSLINQNTSIYIYAAFAENPFNYSRAR